MSDAEARAMLAADLKALADGEPVKTSLAEAVRHRLLRAETKLQALEAVHDPKQCDEHECLVCGVILCPHGEPLHLDKDGCPACTIHDHP